MADQKKPFTLNPLQGNAFLNRNKASEKSPDYVGTLILPDGKGMKISLWKKGKSEIPFFSIALSEQQNGNQS